MAASVDDVNGMIYQIASATGKQQPATAAEVARNIERIAQLSANPRPRPGLGAGRRGTVGRGARASNSGWEATTSPTWGWSGPRMPCA
ncbi:MAG: hypothetical protein MZV65_19020 [Chromatiales bacterium]|nr:hypothetical protein [Chromatiales bacterium]